MQIYVLGMHRSGTSAVARLVNMMGADAGPPSRIGGPSDDNQKGFWERVDVRDLNDELLRSVNCHWDDVARTAGIAKPGAVTRTLLDQVARTVFELDACRPWVLKDPRFCLTFPIWREASEVPVCVLPYRNPLEVAESLQRRNGFPLILSLALWEHYTRSAIAATAGLPRIFLSYEQLMRQPSATTHRLYEWLSETGATGLRNPADREIEAFIDTDLQHHKIPQNEADKRLLPGQNELFLYLKREGQGTLPAAHCHPLSVAGILALHHFDRAQVAVSKQREQEACEEARALRQKIEANPKLYEPPAKLLHTLVQAVESIDDGNRQNREALLNLVTAITDSFKENRKDLHSTLQRVEHQFQKATESNLALAPQLSDSLKAIDRARSERDIALERAIRAESASQTLSARIAEAKHLESVAARNLQDVQTLAHWLDDAFRLARHSFSSMRWRLGDRLVRIAEILLMRGRPRLASDALQQIEGYYRDWRRSRLNESLTRPRLNMLGAPSSGEVRRQRPSMDLVPAARKDRLDVICFPVIDWHFRVQRPQHLARELGAAGHRVFYLGTTFQYNCKDDDYEITERPVENVILVRLRLRLPGPINIYRNRLTGKTLDSIRAAVGKFVSELEIDSPAAIVDLPFWRLVSEGISGAVVVYDCMDYHAGFSTNTEAMLKEEAQLIERADAVLVSSDWLAHEVGRQREAVIVRNGAEISRFGATPDRQIIHGNRPVIGYIGAISEWFDMKLITDVAKRCPDYDFVLVGEVTHSHSDIAGQLDNVRFVGEVPYDQAPTYVHSFDVCTIPFKITPLTIATNPVKVYEYLAAGKAVVATPMPELLAIGEHIRVADNPVSFHEAIEAALMERDNEHLIEARQQWAAGNDWRSRGNDLEAILHARFPRVSVVVLTWNNLEFTRACLRSLERHTHYPGWELVIVDNASTDGTQDFLTKFTDDHSNVKLVFNEENTGFAAGNNVGIRAGSGDYVVLLNNDTYVTPGWLQGLIGHLLRNSDLGIVGPVTNNIGNEARIDIGYSNMEQMVEIARRWTAAHPRVLLKTDVVGFFCCAFSRALTERIGLLDEQFGRGFFEDDDFCRRIRHEGLGVAVAEDVFVHHHLSASFDKLKEDERKRLFEENKTLYEQKWGRWKPHQYRKTKGQT